MCGGKGGGWGGMGQGGGKEWSQREGNEKKERVIEKKYTSHGGVEKAIRAWN